MSVNADVIESSIHSNNSFRNADSFSDNTSESLYEVVILVNGFDDSGLYNVCFNSYESAENNSTINYWLPYTYFYINIFISLMFKLLMLTLLFLNFLHP